MIDPRLSLRPNDRISWLFCSEPKPVYKTAIVLDVCADGVLVDLGMLDVPALRSFLIYWDEVRVPF